MPDLLSTDNGLPPVPLSYYENFLESLARIVSKLVTPQETETVLSSIRSFQERIKRVSSQDLNVLSLRISRPEKKEPKLCQHEGKTCSQNCTRGFIKTFTVAFVVKYVISILPFIISGKLLKRPSVLKQMAGKDTVFFALFLSTFTSSYKGILCALRNYRKSKSDRLNAFIAGSLAGLALALDRDKQRRQSIMLYLFTRALQFDGAWIMKQWAKKREKDHPGKKQWDDHLAHYLQKYSGVWVMMLASAQLLYGYLFNSETLPKSYFSFLVGHSSMKLHYKEKGGFVASHCGYIVNKIVENNLSSVIPKGIKSGDYVSQHIGSEFGSLIPKNMQHGHITCAVQHPFTSSCTMDKVVLFKHEYLRALKLYTPLNIIMLLVFRSKQLATDPKNVLQKFTVSCLRSSLFLTAYVVMSLLPLCVLRNITGRDIPLFYVLNGVIAGSMTFIEVPGRQLEIGLYCLTRAIESFWKTALKNGYVKNIPHGEIPLFMLSMGTLMTLYQNEKDTINSHYLSVMTRFFGQN